MEVGGFDEIYSPGNFEDDDLCMRLRRAGYQLLLLQDTFIHHFGSTSFVPSEEDEDFQKKSEAYQQLLNKNYDVFLKKWEISSSYKSMYDFAEMMKNRGIDAKRMVFVNFGFGREIYYFHAIYPEIEILTVSLRLEETNCLRKSFDAKYAEDIFCAADEIDFADAIFIKIPKDMNGEPVVQAYSEKVKERNHILFFRY